MSHHVRKSADIILGLWFALSINLMSQAQTASPFLAIEPSARANALGGIASSWYAEDALALLSNPGHLGLFSLDHYLIAGYTSPTKLWQPNTYFFGNNSYTCSAINLGYNLSRVMDVSFPIGVGIGYSKALLRVDSITANNGLIAKVLGDFQSQSDQFTFGFGIDYGVRAGIGFTVKFFHNSLLASDVFGPTQFLVAGELSDLQTTDAGLSIFIPISPLLLNIVGNHDIILSGIKPSMNMTIGYSQNNLGNNEPGWGGTPKRATLGMNIRGSLMATTVSSGWELLSITAGREVNDNLIRERWEVDPSSNIVYSIDPFLEDGFGHFQLFKNLIGGNWGGRNTIHSGIEIGLGEFLFLRWGSQYSSEVSITTQGFGLQLDGILKALELLQLSFTSAPTFQFIQHHFDCRYDQATQTIIEPVTNRVTFSGFNLIIK